MSAITSDLAMYTRERVFKVCTSHLYMNETVLASTGNKHHTATSTLKRPDLLPTTVPPRGLFLNSVIQL